MAKHKSESQIKHHPDDWSTTSKHHHHVERTVHPAIVELVKWVCCLKCSYIIKTLIFCVIQATEIVPPDSSSAVFDDACGIGTVTAEVKKHYPDVPVLAIDSSAGMLEVFDHKVKKHDFKHVKSRLLDAGDLVG